MSTTKDLTPKQIAQQLDRYIIGQSDAKRTLAIALRNRWRRKHAVDPMRQEMMPANIILIGATGTGKTECARRMADIYDVPFVKVEATHFTERGYVGSQTASMVTWLVENAIQKIREQYENKILHKVNESVEQQLLEALLKSEQNMLPNIDETHLSPSYEQRKVTLLQQLRKGDLEETIIKITIEKPAGQLPKGSMFVGAPEGMEGMFQGLQDAMKRMFPAGKSLQKLSIAKARYLLEEKEKERMLAEQQDNIRTQAKQYAEDEGIIFIDEIDKLAVTHTSNGHDVSREGVQRELLPLVEGTTISTKYGLMKTNHILFIAAGAFHQARPSDLLPELQSRLPVRVELDPLKEEDLVRILHETEYALIKKYAALFASEGVTLIFEQESLSRLGNIAYQVNKEMEDIGARRLDTVLHQLLQDYLFDTPEKWAKGATILITPKEVEEKLGNLTRIEQNRQYIL